MPTYWEAYLEEVGDKADVMTLTQLLKGFFDWLQVKKKICRCREFGSDLHRAKRVAQELADAVVAGLSVDEEEGNKCECVAPGESCWYCHLGTLANAVYEEVGGKKPPEVQS